MKDNRENISMKEDRYEFPSDEWEIMYGTFPTSYILTRKKPKVEDRENAPVKEDKYFSLYGSWEQFSNFWDAVHHYANNSESRRSPVIASTPQYVRVKEEDYVVFATIVTASGLRYQKSPGPYVEAL